MAPRLILSNAQKSAGGHSPSSVGGVVGSLSKAGLLCIRAGLRRKRAFCGKAQLDTIPIPFPYIIR